MERLPGGLGRVRGWLLLARYRPGSVGSAVSGLGLVGLLLSGAGVLPALAGVVVAAAGWVVLGRASSLGVRVSAHRHPELSALVGRLAARLSVPGPGRIWIGAEPEVVGLVRFGRRELVVGLPLVYGLSRAELSALLEHELAVLAVRPQLPAVSLYRHWADSAERVALLDPGERPGRGDAAVLRTLGSLGDAVERAADAAVADADAGARAVVRQGRLAADFAVFVFLTHQDVRRNVRGRWYRIEDLHDGWRRRMAAGAGLPGVEAGPEDVAEVTARHPGLAAAARHLVGRAAADGRVGRPVADVPVGRAVVDELVGQSVADEPVGRAVVDELVGRSVGDERSGRPVGGEPVVGGGPGDAVPIGELTPRECRRLAVMASPDPRRTWWRVWRTFRTAPPAIWQRGVAGQARQILDNVARVTGYAPGGRLEAAQVVAERPIEVTLAGDTDLSPDDVDAGRASAADWLDLLEDALFTRGWLRVDPAVPGVLRHPDGALFDARSLTDRATTDPAAYAELCRRLGPA